MANRPEIDGVAPQCYPALGYAGRMNILDSNQQAILEAVRAGRYLGRVPLDELRADVDLLLELRIIEPSGACPYRLTAIGARVLAAAAMQAAP